MTSLQVSLPYNLARRISSLAPKKDEQQQLVVQAIRYYLSDIWYEGEIAKRKRALEIIKKLAIKSGNWDGTAEIIKWREKR
ncbi:hypothetical protein A3F08_02025 [Candidatus Berkelbacteria bacterium RIFCSPHIGHO2_12_FULL_36_9]|uniref:CopG family transcriptional regulator n=1 Tax=Candidatus Berkelbacteria bacterium RIFCSPHIGHO2_12_FULL_36_9 TaxID=1797469 RepID=A0A1F5EFC2_9BACT|nr:MAG: hypothetical protein A3F08_02025 [Candidatus Berkelbacteria bacterium RIFCSPHIGHO2_12_FULL_36_9]